MEEFVDEVEFNETIFDEVTGELNLAFRYFPRMPGFSFSLSVQSRFPLPF